MRICLFWNATAGGGNSLDELTAQFAGAGHSVECVVHRNDDLRAHLNNRIDCVAAAGGDGTIARAARALAGGTMPLGIVPSGTANNIATSLGFEGSPRELISRWRPDRVASIDVGIVESPSGKGCFLESVGCGLVTDCIDKARDTISKDDPETHLDDARQLYVEMLRDLDAREYSIKIGDEDVSGQYLLIEVMNMPLMGPGVRLTSEASAADGLLSVVAVDARDRVRLCEYLRRLRDGSTADGGFKSWRVPSLEIRGASRMHVDDRIDDVDDAIRIRIRASSLPILA
jgi:diacylglycerol kinase family enzyme